MTWTLRALGEARTSLVAGGAGFLGMHLCTALLARGDRVICVDDLSSGRKENLTDCLRHQNFTFHEWDITQPMDVGLLGKGRIDAVINLASPASPSWYQIKPITTLETNFIGMRNLLELADRHGARVLQASTSEVYGDPAVFPQSEAYLGNVNSFGSRACYDEGKRAAEALCFAYGEERGLDIRIARIFNTYGPGLRVDDGRAISNFVVQALTGQDVTVYGDGTQTRSMCWVGDLIAGLLALLDHQAPIPGPVNLGNPHEVPVLLLAQMVVALSGSNAAIRHLAPLPEDPMRRCPDIGLAKRILGWTPHVALHDGLTEMIAHYRPLVAHRKTALAGE